MPSSENIPSNLFLQLAVPLLDTQLTALLSFLAKLAQRILGKRMYPGECEILEYTGCLTLLDAQGKHAVFSKHERARFLQDNVIAHQDIAWGVADIFAKYVCSPGVLVDIYREGYRYRILISLRETKNRGDIEDFHIERTILDGFTSPVEDFQYDIFRPMRCFSLSVVFPKDRHPKTVMLIEQNTTRRVPLGPKHQSLLPDGRLQVTWKTRKPRLFESYIIQWLW
jgi:hypothetical protein